MVMMSRNCVSCDFVDRFFACTERRSTNHTKWHERKRDKPFLNSNYSRFGSCLLHLTDRCLLLSIAADFALEVSNSPLQSFA